MTARCHASPRKRRNNRLRYSNSQTTSGDGGPNMAGEGGGGSWKVAYADFVTAMMAFFLVMWICGQDQKIRRSVSDYFSDPLGNISEGTTKKPNRSGSSFESIASGTIPLEDRVVRGQG